MNKEHSKIVCLKDISEIPPGSLTHFTSFQNLMTFRSLGFFQNIIIRILHGVHVHYDFRGASHP